jgi:histone-lysine N-methyltransferase SETD1
VGELVRQKVADMREIKYEKQGVGSSYLFRMLDDEIVDATKKGGIARFINHSCNPNCTAKIIKVEGTPRIVIYAMKDIGKSESLSFHFSIVVCSPYSTRVHCVQYLLICFSQTMNSPMTTNSSANTAPRIASRVSAGRRIARAS